MPRTSKTQKTSKSRFDLFGTLKIIQECDHAKISALSDEELKAISPYLIVRWLSGSPDQNTIPILNEVVNNKVFALQENKRLLLHLLATTQSGKSHRLTWRAAPSSTSLRDRVIMEYYGSVAGDRQFTDDELVNMAQELGYQDAEIKSLRQ